ncbi:MAG: hypothetical protein GW839_09720 [Flavobacteriales bacterium]|nr:hypothetical protein [Flavobacteriia bacterium]NCP06874.1 hypothetical protein [Flavobacteriales bacterium]PIV93633.1 MAG: hypothetical protein COW44_08480 [Flavobacteriaceae bacterium CG17_big_fil_post_rev_8_21_14_2_50_33_15]NCP51487.1 hypothetical protein [Flavobacteriales bacterium]NCP60560.1 hypothetical protein [Flavobacteriales bacterium]
MKTYIFLAIFSIFSITILIGQEKSNDTLFFNFDTRYIKKGVINKTQFHIKDSSYDGTFFFEKIGIVNNIKPKEILCLKKIVRNSKFYDKKAKRKLNDYRLWEYLRDYTIFLIAKNKKGLECIQVVASFEIE